CLGNLMHVDVGPHEGELLEVSAVIDNSSILLTPSLASQCGFSMKTDQLGNTVIFASIQNCFAENAGDKTFTTTLNLRLNGNQVVEDELYQVAETCHYANWASREIICDHNYMEASKCRVTRLDELIKGPVGSGFRTITVVFFTPEERLMSMTEAQERGYGITSTPSRLVVRSPRPAPETYTETVAGVPMTVLKTSTIFEKKWLATQIDAAAACPILEGSVSFTQNTITWYLPWHIDPLISSGQFKLLEVHMGVDGQRLDAAEMAARQYSMSVSGAYVIIEIPIGAVGGYYKSHVQDEQCLLSYTIEPMIELHWSDETTHEDTRYKVLLPITTPLLSQPPQVADYTVPEERVFKVMLGPLGFNVALVNITLSSEVLSVADCNARGFNVLEHISPNSSLKVFTLQVPFTDPKQMGHTVYFSYLAFDLLVLPELTPFSLTAYLEATSEDMVLPDCDLQNFHVFVKYGTSGSNFETVVGKQVLTSDLAEQYSFAENGTHFSLQVPYSSPNAVEPSFIRSRLRVVLKNPETSTNIKEFSLACNFPSRLIECFPNGTITALAVKLESVPSLNPSHLTLRDPTCGPSFSDERYAYFVFTANTCGTTRKVCMLTNTFLMQAGTSSSGKLILKISCYYNINTTNTVGFHTKPGMSEQLPESPKSELPVAMRLALDDSYSVFHKLEDYPVTKYLQQPLYFEVELMESKEPDLSVELENCWATTNADGASQPRWNLIIDGCANSVDPYQAVYHPVWVNARVQNPSHFKRFEVQMFAFHDQDNLSGQLFIHCDVVTCHANKNQLAGSRGGRSQSRPAIGRRRGTPWTGRQSIAGLTQRRTTTHMHKHSYGQFRDTNQPKLHVFGLWEEAGVPGENPSTGRTCKLHTERSQVGPEPGTFSL
uniref:ZP domain-containing protein n=1 Tax=Monopterus albus TaxID=43700 RepID=A0A3Q3KDK6_MONAL